MHEPGTTTDEKAGKRKGRRWWRWLLVALLFPVLLALLVVAALYVPAVQDVVRSKAVGFLHEKLGTPIAVERLSLRFPLGLSIQGLYVEDQQGDTLIHAGELKAHISLAGLFRNRIAVTGLALSDARAHLAQDADSVFNFQFIVDAFASDTTVAEDPDDGPGWRFTVDGVTLRNIHFSTAMEPSRLELDLRLGELLLPLNTFDPDSMRFHAGDLRIADTRIAMRSAAAAPEPDTYPLLESPFGGLDLKMRSAELQRIAFAMSTHDAPDSMWLEVADVKLDMHDMDTRRQYFDVQRVQVDGLHFGMVGAAAETPATDATTPPWLAEDDGFRYFLRDLDVRIGEVDMRSSSFAMHRELVALPSAVFDPAHLVLSGLNARLDRVVANNTELSLEANEISGRIGEPAHAFSLISSVRATPQRMAVTGTRLRWDDLRAELALHAEQGSLHNAYRAPERIPMQVSAKVSAPRGHHAQWIALLPAGTLPVASIPEGFEVQAQAAGTLERLDTIAMDLRGDAGTTLQLHGAVSHVMAPQRTAFDLHLDPFTMGEGARAIALAYAGDAPLLPARLTVQSSLQGDPSAIRGTIGVRSDLADANGRLHVTGWRKELPDALSLDLRATGIALARLLGDTAWSDAALTVHAEATALNTPRREGWLELKPTRLVHGGTDLSDAFLRADVLGDSVWAALDAKSGPLSIALRAEGPWPTKDDDLEAVVDLAIQRADLRLLGLTEHDLAVVGAWKGRVVVDTAGQATFALTMDGTQLESGAEHFVFEALEVGGYLGTDSTSAMIAGDALDLGFDANIGVDTLLARVVEKGRSFLTSDTAHRAVAGERFDLSLDLKRTEWLTGMVVPGLHAIELERCEAHYDGTDDELNTVLVMPHLRYDSLVVEGTAFNMEAKGAVMNAQLDVQRIQQGRYRVDSVSVDAMGSGGELGARLRIAPEGVERYVIGMDVQRMPEGMELRLAPELVLDARRWTVDPANRLLIAKDRMTATDFELASAEERIALRTPERALEIGFDGFRIATLANIISTPDSFPVADGRIDGLVRLPASGSSGTMADLTVDGLELMDTEIGALDLDLIGEANERYRGRAQLTHAVNHLDAKVDLAPENTRAIAALDLRDIGFMQPLVSTYLHTLSGGLDGAVDYSRRGDRTSMRGRLHFKQAQVGVVATGATYTLADEAIEMTHEGLRFDAFAMRDSSGNVFTIDGDIRTEAFAKPTVDLRIRTDRFQLVNSTIEENERFFGDLFARIDLKVKGPAERPTVKGDLAILPGTVFSVVLPGTTVELVSAEGIVVFTDDINEVDTLALNTDAAALRDSLAALLPGVELDLRIKVDKEAVFAIVLDPVAGDQATVSGTADLVFRYAPNTPMYLSGPFVVEHGEYTLDLYGLVKKRFVLAKGGSVTWSGDPVQAVMDLQARYLSETAPYALVASGGMLDSERNRLQQPLPFEVLINIDGSMSAPDIGFGIDLERQVRNSFPKVGNKLDQLNQQGNAEELNRQVFGLLVLNSFIQDEGSGGEPSSGIATSAARNSVNGLLTDQMNKLTGRYLKGVDVSLGVNTYDQVQGQSTYQRTSLDYRVSKRVLDDRLSFEVGGSVGVDEQSSQVSNVSNTRAAQYAILYDLTRDGRFRMRGFHENAYDLYDGEITNSGIAIMFTKDFEENERARASGRKAAAKERARKEEQFNEEER